MIVCPNCNHHNPDGATQCEACYTPLPATTNCPSCGATVQADASFCGQCGYHLRTGTVTPVAATVAPDIPVEVQPLVSPDPLVQPQPAPVSGSASYTTPDSPPLPPTAVAFPSVESSPPPPPIPAFHAEETSPSPPPAPPEPPVAVPPPTVAAPPPVAVEQESPVLASESEPAPQPTPPPPPPAQPVAPSPARTQLQQVTARLVHVQTDRQIELPQNLSVIHIGKPNDRIPPDVDVSGFPNSEIVSRIHSDIRVEGDAYYIEDVGSSNGTYINNLPLLPGNRHRLRPGDRISLGKGDLVTFIFQIS
ncbi:peptide-binding protein [Fischerella thermalis CCMEE 5205]|uniref:Peptide-binding protein n=1 Tax=Fischerella thermalis CCMEE 5318 TaxID=2019666 RepID=A0A2N6L7Y4_9CYAN|nr:FHA domain-containing protein [Fischerella thermalis]PMB18251.1 peptide-binding protein [Fischerella thermalis CCMEE 5318]PMB26635.1 peptide-binding protein [Fischerella thermalis CCMEE 5319]PMB43160.1 peptide-binding protein [Fischerella thermalis CCMEE 5205]